MKIIGRTKRNLLVEMDEDELARVMGYNYACSVPTRSAGYDKFEPGTTVAVSEAWNDLLRFRDAKQKIESAAQTLHGVAQIAEACSAVYTVAPTEETPPTQ